MSDLSGSGRRKLEKLLGMGEAQVGPNAHTVAVDPVSHDVYFPLLPAGARPVLRVMRPVVP